jgi:hypothetical protein
MVMINSFPSSMVKSSNGSITPLENLALIVFSTVPPSSTLNIDLIIQIRIANSTLV